MFNYKIERRIDRRTFVKTGLLAGGTILGGKLVASKLADATDGPPQAVSAAAAAPASALAGRPAKPNILVIVVDQLRYPQWLPGTVAASGGLPPNIARLGAEGVSFSHHYTASNDCTPARATLLTGLYNHQTGCMITGGSTLDPGFPTWGTMLREHGYRTRWYGKWHLTHGDNHWNQETGPPALARYGFAGATFPSPDGAPGQGWRVDPTIADDFGRWFEQVDRREPWCATVSFVNPHDIAWWYGWSDRVPAEAQAPSVATQLPPNFETPEQLTAAGKPRLQLSMQETAAASFGPVPFTGPGVTDAWLPFLDLYIKLQLEVDRHVGQVLDTLASRPEVAANTVVLFTSDHGEYGASHGLRGKGASAYEEAIKVPLIVKDPRGLLAADPDIPREQLTSSVDVAPLLLTLATGSNAWRARRRYSHLAHRLDIAGILEDSSAAGRPYVLHATDEVVTEFARELYAANAPLHIAALRTEQAKYATYSNWRAGGIEIERAGQERELYDYSGHGGRLEVDNSAGESPLEGGLRELLAQAYATELRRPLPPHLRAARRRGFRDYFGVATRAAVRAANRRAERELQELEGETAQSSRARRPREPRIRA
ncbi:MAG TPA: sulfatase-like hydrolase/transferase [Solirubrobacteraceae bacterium]|nr:sulfatase-like hydrolase/transferase [Solirubrobacteraceae bacterium]